MLIIIARFNGTRSPWRIDDVNHMNGLPKFTYQTMDEKAQALVFKGLVKKEVDSRTRDYYKSGNQDVIYNKLKQEYSCTCKWFSVRLKDCSHIKAVKKQRVRDNGKNKNG